MDKKDIIYIDGSIGEGGGQILRTSLTLSCITGKSFYIKNIRAARRNPGLGNQHLSCIKAACQICDGKCQGAETGSRELHFQPSAVRSGNYNVDVGSSGSTTLVGQTVLPALFSAGKTSILTVVGGTHNPMAPPYDFLAKTFLPAISTAGFQCKCTLKKYGFYPAGGGKIIFEIKPYSQGLLKQINLCEPSAKLQIKANIYTAHLPKRIAQRQQKLLLNSKLAEPDCQSIRLSNCLNTRDIEHVEVKDSDGPGNCVTIGLFDDSRTTVFCGFGKLGKPSEKVINEVVIQANDFVNSNAAVDRFLADQLLIYMAITGGGCYTTNRISSHLMTNIEIIKKFLPVDFKIEQQKKAYKVSCQQV